MGTGSNWPVIRERNVRIKLMKSKMEKAGKVRRMKGSKHEL